jgi:hypothetical protein
MWRIKLSKGEREWNKRPEFEITSFWINHFGGFFFEKLMLSPGQVFMES